MVVINSLFVFFSSPFLFIYFFFGPFFEIYRAVTIKITPSKALKESRAVQREERKDPCCRCCGAASIVARRRNRK